LHNILAIAIARDAVAWSQCVCWSRSWTLQKKNGWTDRDTVWGWLTWD